MQRNSHKTSAF